MGKLTTADWNAINWYAEKLEYKVGRDMMAWPLVRFRDRKNGIVDVNIFDIKAKYKGRASEKKTKTPA